MTAIGKAYLNKTVISPTKPVNIPVGMSTNISGEETAQLLTC
jgi:hypothetical protein